MPVKVQGTVSPTAGQLCDGPMHVGAAAATRWHTDIQPIGLTHVRGGLRGYLLRVRLVSSAS
jgi:hypothetical protein